MVGMNDWVTTEYGRRGGHWTEAENNVVEDAARAPRGARQLGRQAALSPLVWWVVE